MSAEKAEKPRTHPPRKKGEAVTRVCPWLLQSVEMTGARYETDENGNDKAACVATLQLQRMGPCLGEACGAWHKGRCRRKK